MAVLGLGSASSALVILQAAEVQLSDTWGRKRVLLVTLAIFAVGKVLAVGLAALVAGTAAGTL
ncbi:MAG TPA: hypothetical protein VFC31_03685 [Candidatus Limnocylindria bacterium]|nr:hypothetical protein [Candidatus Limnocylindria bacterium]